METFTLLNLLLVLGIHSVYVLGLYIYRMYFDSLSQFPGPKLAAASLWYEFYYDVIQKGQYTFEIGRMHEEYGPIVRISPYEIHINDPDFIDEVYPGNSRRTMKYSWSQRMFGLRSSFAVTEGHELHRIRRAALAHYFSKSSLQKLEPGVQAMVDKLVNRLQGWKGSGRNVNLVDAFACLTGDVVGQYAFAKPYGLLDDPDFSPYWHKLMMDVSENTHLLKQFGWLMPLMKAMPRWFVKITNPQMLTLLNIQEQWRNQILKVKASIAEGQKSPGQTTIFHDMLTNPAVRPQEKDTDHLKEEAQAIVGAGTVTTGHILAKLSYYIIAHPSIREKLSAELGTLMSTTGTPRWQQLEQLPYLTATITEGLRIGYGVAHRLQRLFPDTALQYDNYSIPANTPISMSSIFVHDNPSLFPNPRAFDPERFIRQPLLRKYLLTFSKGTRQCAGQNLAYCEIYLTLAALFAPGRFQWDLFETDLSDVELRHDFMNTSPKLNSKGIRVLVN